MSYVVKKHSGAIALDAAWNSEVWQSANVINIELFRDRSTDHHPVTQCRMLHDGTGVYGLFQVRDRYVRSVCTNFNDSVCGDSCVEFFAGPANGKGYLNFEFNCGGTMLVFHVIDSQRGNKGFRDFRPLTEQEADCVKIFHTMPDVVDPEITEPVTWRLGFYVPLELYRTTTGGADGELSGQVWRANLYKCGDKTSHPHWASWQPLTETNFHLPDCFGEITFE